MQSVTAGTRLGPYEIVSRLGAGGMGEVWSARDTRLDRRVAVKILPPELAHDPQFKLRFEREAKTISQLSHPNICTLFDVGDGFLVMELLEGETLADRISRGALPMPEVLRYGGQIAEALGKAHRMSIVHRDLKPANVMITKAGAKLLDFGLAKSSTQIVNVDGATQHKALTQEGSILGTFQYMAPEQLEGQEADARTDIFALGVLLYEMATGRRAFEGKTRTSLIAQIVSAEPKPLRDFQPLTPPAFEHVVARCLSKDPDERWQNAQDVAEELRWAATATQPERRSRRAATLPWAIAAIVFFAALATIAVLLRRGGEPHAIWSDIAAPRDVRLSSPNDRGGSAIAPDGNRITFVGQDQQGIPRLYLRDLRTGDARPIATTENASYPFWSPDSRTVGYFADGKLKRIDVDGTRAAVIAEDVDGRGGTWAADGTIVFAASSTSGLSRIRASGGQAQIVTKVSGDQSSLRFPWFLPDGKHFLYTAMGNLNRGVHIASLDGSVNRKLVETHDSGIFSGGSIVFLRDAALFAQELDLDTLQVRGDPQQIASGVTGKQSFADSGLTASAAGHIVFPVAFEGASAMVWRDRTGAIVGKVSAGRSLYEHTFSPDEKRIVSSSDDPQDSLWEVDVERGRSRRLNLGRLPGASPVWSRDGKRIAVHTTSAGKRAVATVSPTGGTMDILIATEQSLYPETFSPDGSFIVADGPTPAGKDFDLWSVGVKDHQLRPMISAPGNQLRLQFSPDGKFITYNSDETGRPEVFVQSWPLSEGKWQVSLGGGSQSFWRGDGKELFYLSAEGRIMSVAVQADGSFADPVALFRTSLTPVSMTGNRNQYLVTRDGQRFLIAEAEGGSPTHLRMIVNFPSLLRGE